MYIIPNHNSSFRYVWIGGDMNTCIVVFAESGRGRRSLYWYSRNSMIIEHTVFSCRLVSCTSDKSLENHYKIYMTVNIRRWMLMHKAEIHSLWWHNNDWAFLNCVCCCLGSSSAPLFHSTCECDISNHYGYLTIFLPMFNYEEHGLAFIRVH